MLSPALSAILAAAVLSWMHLRPLGRRSARAVPSLQHLRGSRPRRRRVLQLEEPLAWALRTGCLLFALLGVWASRTGCGGNLYAVVVLDPAAPATAWTDAALPADAAARLGFEGEVPRVEGDVPGPVRAALQHCSDTRPACLLRAARLFSGPPLLVGPLVGEEWRLALGRWGRPFAFLRTAVTDRPGAPEAPPVPLAHVRLEGTSPAAQGWAAALAVAAGDALASPGTPQPPASGGVAVVEAGPSAHRAGEDLLSVVAVDGPTPALPDAPAAQARAATGLLLPDPLDLAAGTPGLGLSTSLSFLPDARFADVLPLAALRISAGHRQLALAASAEELGAWAHQGTLVPLSRALLAAGLPGPALLTTAPVGGSLAWLDEAGRRAAVGLLDVAPGAYAREDGRVALRLGRAQLPGGAALEDAELLHLGGQAWHAPSQKKRDMAAPLFAAALALWLVGVWRTRQVRRAWLPAAALAAMLALFWADARWQRHPAAAWEATDGLPPGPVHAQLATLAQKTGVSLDEARDGVLPECATAAAERSCTHLGTLGAAAAPVPGTDVLLFDEERPRVDVLSVEAPHQLALGQAAQLWVTVRVRRANGRRVTLTARSTSAAPTSQELDVTGEDVVRTARLLLAPLTEGISFIAVEAALAGEAQAQDGRFLALATRSRTARRLVLAAAPGWEARGAADALRAPGTDVQLLAQLGTRAVVARGRLPQRPSLLLQTPGGLAGVDVLVLVGFDTGSLDGAAQSGVRRFVESGGAVLVLNAPAAAQALGVQLAPAPAATPLQPLLGHLEEETVAFSGYAPVGLLSTPPLSTVLAELGPAGRTVRRPWVVGRALGRGRLAVVTAPDMWRLSAPGKAGTAYAALLGRLLGWLEAPRASRGGVALSEDWAALRVEDDGGTRVIPLPTTGPVDGLAVDAVDFAGLLRWPRGRLRAEAAGAHHPFLELDGVPALASAWHRLPPAPRWPSLLHLRRSDAAFALLAALLALEALARRFYGGEGARAAGP